MQSPEYHLSVRWPLQQYPKKKKRDRSAVVFKMDSLCYKSMVVGRAPGICCKAQMPFIFLEYGKCPITNYDGLKDLPVASFQSIVGLS